MAKIDKIIPGAPATTAGNWLQMYNMQYLQRNYHREVERGLITPSRCANRSQLYTCFVHTMVAYSSLVTENERARDTDNE